MDHGTLQKIRIAVLATLFGAALVGVLRCSNPSDSGPLQWRTQLDLPVTNEKFVVGEQFGNLFNEMKILDGDTARQGDTLAFVQTDTAEHSFVRDEDSLETKRFAVYIPPIILNSSANASGSLPTGLPAGNLVSDTPLHSVATINVPGVYSVVLEPVAQTLTVRVHNYLANAGARLDSVRLALLTMVGPISGTPQNAAINHGEYLDISFPVGGLTLDSLVRIDVRAALAAGTRIESGDNIGFALGLSGLAASRVTLLDSLFPFDSMFQHNYKITDSIDLKYIDMKDGHFTYSVDNSTNLKLAINGEHLNVWDIRNCTIKEVEDTSRLYLLQGDSALYYYGSTTQGDVNVEPDSVQIFAKLNCSRTRMFPEWDNLLQQSVTRVRYRVRNVPTGRRVTVATNDSLVFVITPATFSFDKFKGIFKEDFVRQSDTDYIAIPFIWDETSKDSLRGRFFLNRVVANVEVEMNVAEKALLSSNIIRFRVFNTKDPSIFCDTTVVFDTVHNGAVYRPSFRVENVVNSFPDSVGVVITTTVPKDSMVVIVNDETDTSLALGRMTVRSTIRTRMDAYMDWEIKAPVTMDLGAGNFPVTDEAINYFRKASDRNIAFNLKVQNVSNLNMRLYSLLAPLEKKVEFDSLSSGEVSAILLNGTASVLGYVSLLGQTGVVIPARGSTVSSLIDLDETEIGTILNTDSCFWRWQARFEPMSSDALTDNDYIDIRSWLHFDGTSNLDSIMSFTE